MSEIERTQKIFDLLRTQFDTTHNGSRARKNKQTAKKEKTSSKPKTSPTQNFEHRLLERINTISEDDPAFEKKLFQAFLEITLIEELGEDLLKNPRHPEMFKYVEEKMLKNPALATSIRAAIDHLKFQTKTE